MGRDDQGAKSPSEDPADAEAETRMVDLDETQIDDSLGGAAAENVESVPSKQGLDDQAATVLSSDDDRTHLVDRQPSAQEAETRALASPPTPAATAEADAVDATRALTPTDDKTAPPAVGDDAAVASAPSSPGPDRGLTPGSVLFGEYEIANVLGVGGMGEVYRARHRRLDEYRAIKVMHAELANKQAASEFFYREAKALLAVRHPAVVHCHDLLSDDEGRVYLVMEMIEGIPLSKKMNDGPLSADEVAILGARVSHGLSAAHRKGVIHRDVSPDNIVLPNGRVQEAKIIDFGIAKILQQGEGTIVDGFKGKLSYASPEQLGFFGGKIDGRSDFYSLGLVLVAAALGKPMGMGTTVMEAVDARRGFEALPDEIPVGLRSAIQPLLALDPQDRPQHVDRLFVVPGGIESTEPGGYSNRHATYENRAEEKQSSRAGLIAAAAVAGLIVVGGGGYWISERGGDSVDDLQRASEEGDVPALEVVDSADVAEIAVEDAIAAAAVAPVPAPVVEEPTPVIAKVPEAPRPKRVTASDRFKIIGLINNAKLALSENRLMTPAGDNAYDRYRSVLAIDSKNSAARDGLRAIADRYLRMADSALAQGKVDQARDLIAKARKADSSHPGLAEISGRLSG